MKHVFQPRTPSWYDDAVGRCYVPADHLLRRVNAAVDFSFVRAAVAELYPESDGRRACDPEMLMRLTFLQTQYHLSDRGGDRADAERPRLPALPGSGLER